MNFMALVVTLAILSMIALLLFLIVTIPFCFWVFICLAGIMIICLVGNLIYTVISEHLKTLK